MTLDPSSFDARNQMEELVHAVRAHAISHYNTNGWDILVECWDDEHIAKVIGSASSPKQAIANCGQILRVASERRADIEATAF